MDIKELNVNVAQKTTQNHPWEYARAKVVMDLLKKHLKNETIEYAIDIGCGDLFFLHHFCQKHTVNHPIAIDTAFNEDVLSSLKFNSNNIVLYDNINKIDLEGKKANIIFLMDVIEHIEHDSDFLKEIASSNYVGTDTIFMITVPAYNKLFSSHDRFVGHFRRYTQKTLQHSIQSSGFQCVENGYFFTSLIIARFFQKIAEKIKGGPLSTPVGAGGWNGNRLISKLYEVFLLCDYHFFRLLYRIGIKTPGLSAYCICKITNN